MKLRQFFDKLDDALAPRANGKHLDLYLIGRAALIWRHGVQFATKDVDVVKTGAELEGEAQDLFGKETEQAKALDLYLDLVPSGLPPLPTGFQSRCTEISGDWQVIRVWELEPNDLAATKMKSFRPQDREDLRILCEQGDLQPEQLRASVEKAWLWSTDKDGDEMRDTTFLNLNRVIEYLEGRSKTL